MRRRLNSKTRLIYLHQYYQPPEVAGNSRSHEFALRLARIGYDVHIVTSQTNGEAGSTAWSVHERDGFTVHSTSVPYSANMSYSARILAFMRFAFRAGQRARQLRGDLIYATSTPLTIIIPAFVAKVFRRVPLVFEVRDLWPEVPIALGALPGSFLQAAARLLERFAYSTSTHVVALSETMKEGVVRAGTLASSVTVIPNSADLDRFTPSLEGENPWLAEHPELEGRKLIVYCGAIGRVNGLSYLVDLADKTRHRAPELAFVIVGSGQEEASVREYARSLGVLDVNLFLFPIVPRQDLPQVLRAASVALSLVIPVSALEANSANKFFDGLAAGRPVGINYGGWQKKVLESNDAGIVLDPIDRSRAADELVNLVYDEPRLRQVGRNARELAERNFSRDDAARALANVLESVLSVR